MPTPPAWSDDSEGAGMDPITRQSMHRDRSSTVDGPAKALRLAAVILNYRTPGLTIDCLASLEPQRGDGPELCAIVVDNASGDGSDDLVERQIQERGWSSWARVVRSPVNGGFAAGNNVGIRAVEPGTDASWLLNSDTIVRPGALAELARVLVEKPDVGLLSPRLEWPDGTPQESCFRYLRPLTELVRSASTGPISKLLPRYITAIPVSDEPLKPEWTSFASVLIRSWVFERIGLLDEGYFMYYEDVDFCRRARQAGIPILHWPTARVVHLRGQSSSVKKDSAQRKRRPAYFYAARGRYYAKFHGWPGYLAANLCWGTGRAIAWLREIVGHKQPHACPFEGRDIWINWRNPAASPRSAPGAST